MHNIYTRPLCRTPETCANCEARNKTRSNLSNRQQHPAAKLASFGVCSFDPLSNFDTKTVSHQRMMGAVWFAPHPA